MTLQVCDTCKIDGRDFYFTDPMSERPTVAKASEFIETDPHHTFILSCNWRGYVAHWRIEGGALHLDSVEGKYRLINGKPVVASWITGEFEASAIANDYPPDPDNTSMVPTRERYFIKVLAGYVIGLVYFPPRTTD